MGPFVFDCQVWASGLHLHPSLVVAAQRLGVAIASWAEVSKGASVVYGPRLSERHRLHAREQMYSQVFSTVGAELTTCALDNSSEMIRKGTRQFYEER